MLNEIIRVLKPEGIFAMVTVGTGLIATTTIGLLYLLKTYKEHRREDEKITVHKEHRR